MTNKINEKDLIEKKDLRNKLMDKVNILEKVKELILLPNTELMTTKMVADWYEVTEEAVKWHINENKQELMENGFTVLVGDSLKDFKSNLTKIGELAQWNIGLRTRALSLFSKRAVLNIGMLLRDSEVAKRLRTSLLDQQEIISDNQKTLHINIEQEMALKIMFAESDEEKMLAFNNYRQFKNRHLEQLEKTIQEQQPKVKKYDAFIDGKNYKKMNNVAKSLGYGRNKLYEFLRDKKVLMSDNLPYQRYINSGHFTVKENPIQKNGFTINHSQTYVSAKGIDFIDKLLKESSIERIN